MAHMRVLCMQRMIIEDEGTTLYVTMRTTHTTTVLHPKILNYKIAGT